MPRDIRLYLDDILEAIGRIREYTTGLTHEGFASDQRTVDAVIRNLEVIGEAARALPDAWKEKAPSIEWHKIVGLRNLLIHEYFGVNLPILWDVIQSKLNPLEEECRKLMDIVGDPDIER